MLSGQFTDYRTSPGSPFRVNRNRGSRVTGARTSPNRTPEEQAMRQWLAPIPRGSYESMDDEELGAEIKRLFVLKKADMAPRIALDMRLLRWWDPQKMSDTWQGLYTGKVIPKLYHNSGLATENVPWSGAVVEAMVGLLAGNKPMAYMYVIDPRDAASDADMLQADMVEKLLDRWVQETDYPLTYQDHVTNVVALGRSWKYITTDPDSLQTNAELLWPGHVAAFWQTDRRTLEQVIIERQLTLDEALRLYPLDDAKKAAIESAVRPPKTLGLSQSTGVAGAVPADRPYANVTILTHWYRIGEGKHGGKRGQDGIWKPQIGMMAVLMYNPSSGAGDMGSFVLFRDDDTGYEDIPAHCTPRMRVSDRDPDESFGVLMMMAGLHTQYNEVFSAFRDMLWRTIYARYVAKGFTFRNAPKIIPGSGIYALPRVDQDFKRIEEAVNTVPIEQFLTHLEELIIVMPGLNRFFLGSAPPSETSGESITAAINASVTRIEPVRTNVQSGEQWTYRQVLSQHDTFHVYTFDGRTITAASLIEGIRHVNIHWRDVTPHDADKAKRTAMEAVQQGLMSHDTAMDEFDTIHSKPDERRKIMKERKDVVLSPQTVAATANAITQQAVAQAHQQTMANGGQNAPSTGAKIVLSAKLTPDQEAQAAANAGLGGGAQNAPAGPGQAATPAGAPAQQANADAAMRVAAAVGAPKAAGNRPGTGNAGGRLSRAVAPIPRGQVPGRAVGRIGGR